ncbi:MAG: hybrid sensor histidine kinase/response regulator [Planctomycetota bacterium]
MSSHMRKGEASIVLDALTDVYTLDDVQEVVDRVCQCAVAVSPYRLALLSLYFGDDVYIGLEGGPESLRQHFLQTARDASHEQRAEKRAAIWTNYRIDGTAVCFIPNGSEIRFGPSYQPSPHRPGSEWQSDDRIMVFVRGVDGEVHGVLSLDDPSDGKRPDAGDLGSLLDVERLMKLMGVFIHNKHLDTKLRDSEARYSAVVEQSHDGILIEREGRIRFANRRIGQMLDTMPGLLLGRSVDEVISRSDVPLLPNEDEGVLHGRDGRTCDVSMRTTRIRFGGELANLISVQDITERKRIMARLQRSQKMESVGTLASGIAHDFNNLLGGILGYASLLRMRMGPLHELGRYVESIESAAERASSVTRQLLGIVRDEQVRVGTFPVTRVLDDLAGFLRETFPPSIRIETEYQENLPNVLGDEGQVHQVLLNVCLNARDAMPEGGTLTLRATCDREDAHGEYLRLTIEDTGTGIDAETLAQAFDPFFTTKEAGQGTGLGLYMAYRVVGRHGGRVDLHSEVGVGTTVEILLPSSAEQRSLVAGPSLPDATQVDGTVLLVDDEDLIREMGREMLERLGFEVVLAEDGPEALNIAAEQGNRFTCAIVDIAMPGMSGWEVVSSLRTMHPRMPIVVSSGHEAGLALGDPRGIPDAQFLKKPYRLKELNAVLAEVLAINRAGTAKSDSAR